ncbi:MAG: hypothetical protein V5B44_04205 [Candidatus Accumulibacter necessarius]|jgi:hypothetical protein|uniref:hypothetical protein n=1 Tax=Candidatus Accumulibacter necessarius TaxID=2954386 RepID=UPI002FC2DBDF
MLAAYNGAECFLRLTPGMAMADLSRLAPHRPGCRPRRDCRQALREQLRCASRRATGPDRLRRHQQATADRRLAADRRRPLAGPASLAGAQANVSDFEPLGRPITDLLRSVDAVIAKPGYGTFSEAACNGTPVLYVRRQDWPEQDCLIDWLHKHATCREISESRSLLPADDHRQSGRGRV